MTGRHRTRIVDTPSLRVHLREAGEGEPLLLIHGFPQDSWMWRHQLDALSRRWHCIAPDTRGFGLTERPGIRVTRDLLVRDLIDLIDTLGFEQVRLVGHDWGAIIASAAALRHPERFSHLCLLDGPVSVWPSWGLHGFWFKDEPRAEQFFQQHAADFIRARFGRLSYPPFGPPPDTPWLPLGGEPAQARAAHPETAWSDEDVEHYVEVFSDAGAWFHVIDYYRSGLPFHRETRGSDGRARYTLLTPAQVAAIWNHEGGIAEHPDFGEFFVFAPEDRRLTYEGPTTLGYSRILAPSCFEPCAPGEVPPDDVFEAVNPFMQSFWDHFPTMSTRAVAADHHFPEECPERTNEIITELMEAAPCA